MKRGEERGREETNLGLFVEEEGKLEKNPGSLRTRTSVVFIADQV